MHRTLSVVLGTVAAGVGVAACSSAPPAKPAESLETDFGQSVARATRTDVNTTSSLIDKASGQEVAKLQFWPAAHLTRVFVHTESGGLVKGTLAESSFAGGTESLTAVNHSIKGLYDSGRRAPLLAQGSLKPHNQADCTDECDGTNDDCCGGGGGGGGGPAQCAPYFQCETLDYVYGTAPNCWETNDTVCTNVFADCSTATSTTHNWSGPAACQ